MSEPRLSHSPHLSDLTRGWQKLSQSLTFKLFSMSFLLLIALIPVAFIQGLVSEREHLQVNASQEINRKWSDPQTIAGPILTVPWQRQVTREKGQSRTESGYLHLLPQQLTIDGQLQPESLHRGIYRLTVYSAQLKLSGHFAAQSFTALPIAAEHIRWEQAFVSLGLSDLRGIQESVRITWGKQQRVFDPGSVTDQLYKSGIHTRVPLSPLARKTNIPFTLHLKIKGTEKLFFMPVGQETRVHLAAPWGHPSFDGAFLPDQRQVSARNFSAHWKILHLNRNYPQLWQDAQYSLEGSASGVWLMEPLSHYHKVMRSVKYALFFIGLTFLTFFLIEMLTGRLVHPLQYLLIGFAICVFYTLLLSMSELIGFEKAYAIAAGMTVALISCYSAGFLRHSGLAILSTGTLTTLYGFIYILIDQQDYALLIGSLGLFVILALVMFCSLRLPEQTTA
jgi:inner membrane protein